MQETLTQRLLGRACDIRPEEIRTTLASFSLVLVLMGAYYILRPLRDAMASDWSDAEVSLLWTFTFVFCAIAVSLYGGAVSKVRFRSLVPSVYGFFAASFLAFYIGTQLVADRTLIDKSFYVWISVFSLFHISVFWSFMSDTFASPQATRLFGFIGAGASVGAIVGPTIAGALARFAGTDAMLLVASVLVIATLPLITWIQKLKFSDMHNRGVEVEESKIDYIGGNPLAGFSIFFQSRYLLGIGLFIFLYTSIGSFVYFELKNLLVEYTREERSQIYSAMDIVTNTLTLLIAAFATGRIATRLGLPFTLASVPVLIGVGMLLLAAAPMIGVVVAVQIARRAGNYALSRPGREMLFTAVDRETRFKAKPVVDIVIYRGGDMVNAWAFTALTQGLGLGLGAVAGVGAGIALVWAGVGVFLGREFNRLRENGEAEPG